MSTSPRFWKHQIGLFALSLTLLLGHGSAALAGPTASFSAAASGPVTNLTLTATINPADADVGQAGVSYLAANFKGTWFVNNGAAWSQYQGPAVPTYSSGPITSRTFDVVRNADVSSLIGAQIYVGYGRSESDMTTNGKFAMVYTIGQAATPRGPAIVNLGTAGNFAILAKTAISTVPASVITGDVGVSPAATSYLTGFSLTMVGTTAATSPQVTGTLYGADMTAPTSTKLTTAVLDMQAAYTDAAGRSTPDSLNLNSGNVGGLTLAPGLYNWGSSVTAPADVTISGGADDVWIFQTSGDLTVSPNKRITLVGGAQAKNIFWQVAGKVTVGAGAQLAGNVLCKTDISLMTGANLNGRALAQTQVALQSATVTQPAP